MISETHKTIAIQAAVTAGKAIMDIYKTDFNIEFKEDTSPVTQADLKANTIINKYLEKTGLPVLSEENVEVPYEERRDWTRFWMVDPLDGTKEFVKKNGEFTVNIALIENNCAVFGIIYAPFFETLYMGDTSSGVAYKLKRPSASLSLNEVYLKGQQLSRVSGKKKATDLRVLCSKSHINIKTLDYINSLKTTDVRVEQIPCGSSLKFCILAEGSANLYPRFSPCMEWDTAAGQAICEATGLKVLDFVTKSPLIYNKENLFNESFVVARQ